MGKKAEMGVGTLIIFIALLLVAAVAAGVLIQTSASLQQKALETGRQAVSQISTNAVVLEVSAEDGSTGQLDDFFSYMKLAPGSDDIILEDAIMTFAKANNSYTYTYVDGASTNALFNVTYVQKATNWKQGNLQRGDVIIVNFQIAEPIDPDEEIQIRFLPKTGTPSYVSFVTPEVISNLREYLYP